MWRIFLNSLFEMNTDIFLVTSNSMIDCKVIRYKCNMYDVWISDWIDEIVM